MEKFLHAGAFKNHHHSLNLPPLTPKADPEIRAWVVDFTGRWSKATFSEKVEDLRHWRRKPNRGHIKEQVTAVGIWGLGPVQDPLGNYTKYTHRGRGRLGAFLYPLLPPVGWGSAWAAYRPAIRSCILIHLCELPGHQGKLWGIEAGSLQCLRWVLGREPQHVHCDVNWRDI